MSPAYRLSRGSGSHACQVIHGSAGDGEGVAPDSGPGRTLENLMGQREGADTGVVQPFAVIGTDDRQLVGDTSGYPWRAICRLDITAANGASAWGTGWMVSPQLVITAGHCLYDPASDGWARRVEVRTGLARLDPVVAKRFLGTRGWVHSQARAYDYGGIILPPDSRGVNVGDVTGFFGVQSASGETLEANQANLAGFPKDPPHAAAFGTLWWHSRTIRGVGRRLLRYTLDTDEGQSGAPVWMKLGNHRRVVGIHVSTRGDENIGVRITGDVIATVRDWISRAERVRDAGAIR